MFMLLEEGEISIQVADKEAKVHTYLPSVEKPIIYILLSNKNLHHASWCKFIVFKLWPCIRPDMDSLAEFDYGFKYKFCYKNL